MALTYRRPYRRSYYDHAAAREEQDRRNRASLADKAATFDVAPATKPDEGAFRGRSCGECGMPIWLGHDTGCSKDTESK